MIKWDFCPESAIISIQRGALPEVSSFKAVQLTTHLGRSACQRPCWSVVITENALRMTRVHVCWPRELVIQCACSSVGSLAFWFARRAEGEAFDEAPGEAARLFTADVWCGGEVIAQVGDVFVGLAEAGLFLSMSSAEKQLCPALQKAHCRKHRGVITSFTNEFNYFTTYMTNNPCIFATGCW